MPQSHTLKLCLASLCLVLLWSPPAYPATWTADATFMVERKTDTKADGTLHTDEVEQNYTLTYETNLLETLEFTLDFAFDIEEIRKDPGSTIVKTKPSVDARLVAQWWDLFASWEELVTEDSDPEKGTTVKMLSEFEGVVEPEYEVLPAFRFKILGGNDDITDRVLDLNFEYGILEMVDMSFDVRRETVDKPDPDSDTERRKVITEVNVTQDLTNAISFEADWKNERRQDLLLTDQAEILARDDLLSNDLSGILEWNMLDLILARIERKIEWDSYLEEDRIEVLDRRLGDLEFDHDFSEVLRVNLAYKEERKDDRKKDPHLYTVTRDYTAELDFAPFEWLTISPSFDRNDKTVEARDPETETDEVLKDTYEVLFDYALWGEFLALELTRTWDITWEEGTRTKDLRTWDVELTAIPLYVPNLEIEPSYTVLQKVDGVGDTGTDKETFEVDIGYEIGFGDRLVLTLDHTYERIQEQKDNAKMTTKRTDDTDLALTWDEFFRGMRAELSLARKAIDTSGDDQGPKIDTIYTATYEWDILTNYSFSFEYDRNVKGQAEDTQGFTTTFSAEFFNGRITLDLEHEFLERLEGVPNDKNRFQIELAGEF